MAGVQLGFTPLIEEWLELSKIASRFIDPRRLYALDRSRELLRDIRDGSPADKQQRWELEPRNAIRTILSDGEFGGQGAVWATLSFVWEITPRAPNIRRGNTHFEITGNASTRIRLYKHSEEGDIQLAMWRMEIGTTTGPGATFHAQILGEEEEGYFPKSLPIPRFPIFLATPASALEFVIAELFQTAWPKYLGTLSSNLINWRAIQSKRLKKYHEWNLSVLGGSLGSPITELKNRFPEPEWFLDA